LEASSANYSKDLEGAQKELIEFPDSQIALLTDRWILHDTA
jgi:hypothetical protein